MVENREREGYFKVNCIVELEYGFDNCREERRGEERRGRN